MFNQFSPLPIIPQIACVAARASPLWGHDRLLAPVMAVSPHPDMVGVADGAFDSRLWAFRGLAFSELSFPC